MALDTEQKTAPAPEAAGPTDPSQTAAAIDGPFAPRI